MKWNLFKKAETRSVSTQDSFLDSMLNRFSLYGNKTKVDVTVNTALAIPSVWAAVRVVAETISSLDIRLLEFKDDHWQENFKHPVSNLLRVRPHPEMSLSVFKSVLSTHMLLRGNAFVYVDYDNNRTPKSMIPLYPDSTVLKKNEKGHLCYFTRINNKVYELPREDVIHIPGFSLSGANGADPIAYLNESLGLTLSAQSFGAEFFGNGGSLSGVLETEKDLSSDKQRNLAAAWVNAYTGSGNQHKTAVLTNGLTYKAVGSSPDKAQFIETRKYQTIEVCRIFRVSPHLIYDLEKATFSNIENQGLDFVKYTLAPQVKRIEEALLYGLMKTTEQASFKIKFNFDDLLQGDAKSRADFYSSGIQNGWMSKNEVRRREGLPPVDGGDRFYTPLNMVSDEELERHRKVDDKISEETKEE